MKCNTVRVRLEPLVDVWVELDLKTAMINRIGIFASWWMELFVSNDISVCLKRYFKLFVSSLCFKNWCALQQPPWSPRNWERIETSFFTLYLVDEDHVIHGSEGDDERNTKGKR